MNISVIVPTFNRAASLDALLDDLSNQDGGALSEILVVDNGSSDRTREIVQQHAARDSRIRYLFENRPGASNARNAGIAAATAPVLAFIDDDIRPRNDWVATIARAFAEHPEVDCIGGRVEPRWPRTPPQWLTPAHWPPLALQVGRGTAPYIDREHASACLGAGNFACRADVLREVGGFAQEFPRDEDRELNLRLWRAGKRGMYVDSMVTFAEIQPERLTKRHHRQWYHVTGASHARMRYRDAIDRNGRLDDAVGARGRVWWGVPGFIYREFAAHAAGWLTKIITGRWDEAFYDECRLRYFGSYIVTRWREHLGARHGRAARRLAAPRSI